MPLQKTLEEHIKKQTQNTQASQQTTPQYRTTGFYKETTFQDTPLGKIPREWKIVKLKDICEKIKAGGTPPTSRKEFYNGDIPFVKIEDITNIRKYLRHTSTTITKAGLENSNAWLVPPKSLLFAMYGSIGAVAINDVPVATNQAILAIVPDREKSDVEFLYYLLIFLKPYFEKYAKRTTQANLTAEIVREFKIPFPPLQEQRGIAEILSTVDRAIEGVNDVVARLERLKKALMKELLTGRVRVREENGKLIFHRETEFQETEIGKIPKGWKLVKFKEASEIRKGKRISGSAKSVAFIPMEAIPDNSLYAKYELRNVDEVKSYVYCEPGDILLAKITPSFENGKQGIVPEELRGKIVLATTEVYPIKCKNIDKYFLFYLLKYPLIRNKLASLMRGTTGRKRVPREALEELLLPHPPITEQRRIAEILLSIDRAIELYQEKRLRLKRLKRGLMDLLLTGRVRVRVERVT